MPKRILHARIEQKTIVVKKWFVYSTNREHCFIDEISKGYFGPEHVCGCTRCSPEIELPQPLFDHPFVATARQPVEQKPE